MNSNQNQQEMSKKSFLVFQQIILDAHALVGSEQSTFAFLSLSKWKLSCALLSQFKKRQRVALNDYQISAEIFHLQEWL